MQPFMNRPIQNAKSIINGMSRSQTTRFEANTAHQRIGFNDPVKCFGIGMGNGSGISLVAICKQRVLAFLGNCQANQRLMLA